MKKFFTVLAIFALVLAGCDNGDSTNNDENLVTNVIKWDNEPDGTLEVHNNSSNDMVLFHGQLLSVSSILGGVRKSSDRTFDISSVVDDFNSGGYMIVRGITIDEYNKNKSFLAVAKVEYSAIVIYGQGRRYRAEINPVSFGDYCFKVTNTSRYGIELRKNSPYGEKISYLPPMEYNYTGYTNSADTITVFPVYIFYNQLIKAIITFTPNSIEDSVSITPRPINESLMTYMFPVDSQKLQEQITGYTYPAAFIRCTNNASNASSLQSGGTVYTSENGYTLIGTGETHVFGLTATPEGQEMNLNMGLFNGMVSVPVKQNGNTPILKNGYFYTLTLNYIGGGLYDPASYSAVINTGSKLDIQGEIIP